jgi:4,5-dihydroxyphthalate decarboxylase
VASSLFQALDDRKEMARKRMELKTALQDMIPWLGQELDDIQETFGGDY